MLSPRGDDAQDCPYVLEQRAAGNKVEPDFSRIQQPWGIRCFVVLEKPNQLGARGRYGYLLGVSEEHRTAVHVYMPSTDHVITSQNVYYCDTHNVTMIPSLADNDLFEVTLDELPPISKSEPIQRPMAFPIEDLVDAPLCTGFPEVQNTASDTARLPDFSGGGDVTRTDPISDTNTTNVDFSGGADVIMVTGTSDDVNTTSSTPAKTDHSNVLTLPTLSQDEDMFHVWDGPITAPEVLVDGHPTETTTNDDGELVIGLDEAIGHAVYDDDTCGLCPDWDHGLFAARGFNCCSTLANWGTDGWLYDALTID
jgi:hypothetical protein